MERVRVKNARTLRARLDEILRDDPHADIILGGDFNSQYNQSVRYAKTMAQTGLNDVLGSQGDEDAVRKSPRGFYNLWYQLPPAQRGSDTFRGEWGTLVQLIVSRGLLDYRGAQYIEGSMTVLRIPGINVDVAGVPIRWSFDGPGGAGFSDHLPIYARFQTVRDNDAERYIPVHPRIEETVASSENAAGTTDVATRALPPEKVPAGAALQSPEFVGKIVHVDGKVGEGTRLTVIFQGAEYDVWSYDASLRKRLRATHRAGEPIRFYGEVGLYKGHWQFVVRDENWVK
jgi:hypothetical protein